MYNFLTPFRCDLTLAYSPLLWLLIGTSLIGVMLYLYSRRFEPMPETKFFQMLIILATGWSVLQALCTIVDTLDGKIFLNDLKFLFAPFISVAVFGLLIGLDGRGRWFTNRSLMAISIVPLITAALALTSQWHTLFLYDYSLSAGTPAILQTSEGVWYPFYLVYSYGIMIVAIIDLVDSTIGANALFKKQAAIIGLSFIPPLLSDAAQNYFGIFGSVDFAPATFVFSGAIMAWGLYHYQLLDVRPIARGEVVESMPDAMLIIDLNGRLVDVNPSAEPLLIFPSNKAFGLPVELTFCAGADLKTLLDRGAPRGELTVGNGSERRVFDVSIMSIRVRSEMRARMILLRDITDRQNAEEALRAANARLDILSSLTRHDLLNRLAVIDGYVSLGLKSDDLEKIRIYLEKTERSSEAARSLIEFTGDYQCIGIKAPAWIRVDEAFRRAVSQLALENLEVACEVEGLYVYADAMLEKVFYNLIDNSLSHGGEITTISLRYEEHSDRLVLVYRDDGVGVTGKEKPLIFLRGFGAKTGLGLFLVREILAITEIEIIENGVEGRGARFEMLVPRGSYRLDHNGTVSHPSAHSEKASTEH
ncbi:MAG: histidine kinase N-terminal 7TM domain-containing protein [Methanomassiliicoccus sp.]|nr:histidine kinase N-terminal 7TM domain-containing protein [Methanomassiliicoccus sp.]